MRLKKWIFKLLKVKVEIKIETDSLKGLEIFLWDERFPDENLTLTFMGNYGNTNENIWLPGPGTFEFRDGVITTTEIINTDPFREFNMVEGWKHGDSL